MNELKVFKNELFEVKATIENETVLFDAETVARCLGLTEKKNDVEYVMWRRVNNYLKSVSADVSKGDMIPEPMVYKLAFKASNETAEKFQDWLAIEVLPKIRKTGTYIPDLSQLSPELQLMNTILQGMAKQELAQKDLENRFNETQEEIQDMRDVIEIKPFDNWREETTKQINKICLKNKDYKEVRNKIYEALDWRAGSKIKIRLENMKARAILAGSSKSKAESLTYLDVIAEDKKLIEIYTAIVKEMAIKKGVV